MGNNCMLNFFTMTAKTPNYWDKTQYCMDVFLT